MPASLDEARLYRKVTRRLVPFLFLCYVVAYLDRVNVGFAKLQMQRDLGFSDTVYGLGAGIFFLGYFFFEVPSNIILHRIGARIWIARIMVTWGLISSAMMFVRTPAVFYGLRFLLGLAEAGFFPGIILYLTYWFPRPRRGRITALFMTAIAFSGIVCGPVSGWIMEYFSGVGGLAGWQWLFLLEGIPSVLIGLWVLVRLDNTVEQAPWLDAAEKARLALNLAAETSNQPEATVREALTDPRVLRLALIYFLFVMGLYGVGFWLPQLIKDTGVNSPLQIGLLSAIPYSCAAVGMVLISRHSDRTGERRWHIGLTALAGSLGLIGSTYFGHNTIVALALLTVATAGILTCLPLFWTLPTEFLAGTAAAAGIGLINSIGNLAGFVSPYAMGYLQDLTGRTQLGLFGIAACLALGALLVFRASPIPAKPSPP